MRISDWSSDVCSSDLGRWKEQHFRAHQRHDARSFRIPLVPAYADANRSVAGFPHLEAAIAGAEIVFFFIAWPVGNMTFAIDAHEDRKSVVGGESGSVRVYLGVGGTIKNKRTIESQI